jgi:hypothetical protein
VNHLASDDLLPDKALQQPVQIKGVRRMQTIEVPSTYIAVFKVGDNMVYNANILCNMVEKNENGCFNKPILMQVASLIEAGLAEVIFRARHFNREGVPNVSEEDRRAIADKKKVDKLNTIIDVMKKYKVIDGLGDGIYEELHRLRKYRNKIHIQDDVAIDGVSRDERSAFTTGLTSWSVDLCRRVLVFLSTDLARPDHIHDYVAPLKLPAAE